MAITYLKKSPKTSSTDDTKTTGIVQDLLKDIEKTKEQGCIDCLLYTSPSPRDGLLSRMPSSA